MPVLYSSEGYGTVQSDSHAILNLDVMRGLVYVRCRHPNSTSPFPPIVFYTVMQTTEITLPDLFSLIPFSWDGCNPSFSKDDYHSTDWILSYTFFTDKMRARLGGSRIEILGANA